MEMGAGQLVIFQKSHPGPRWARRPSGQRKLRQARLAKREWLEGPGTTVYSNNFNLPTDLDTWDRSPLDNDPGDDLEIIIADPKTTKLFHSSATLCKTIRLLVVGIYPIVIGLEVHMF